jgi:hypothetical protein
MCRVLLLRLGFSLSRGGPRRLYNTPTYSISFGGLRCAHWLRRLRLWQGRMHMLGGGQATPAAAEAAATAAVAPTAVRLVLLPVPVPRVLQFTCAVYFWASHAHSVLLVMTFLVHLLVVHLLSHPPTHQPPFWLGAACVEGQL